MDLVYCTKQIQGRGSNKFDLHGALKPLFKVAQLGTTFNPKHDGVAKAVCSLLDRPLEDYNIVTTKPLNTVQFYGWKSPIGKHSDNTGYVFFMPMHIEDETDYIIVANRKLKLEIGGIYAMNDAVQHATKGRGKVVAAFYGSFSPDQVENDPALLEKVVQKFKEHCY